MAIFDKFWETTRTFTPGLVLLLVLAEFVTAVADRVDIIHPLLFAIVTGFFIGNAGLVPKRCKAGLHTYGIWLTGGIILMGVSLSLHDLITGGLLLLGIVVGMVMVGIVFTEYVARRVFDLKQPLGSLLAAGSSICGVSAVVAVATSIKAKESHIAYVAGAVVLFDGITVILFPILGQLLGLSDIQYGVWVGVSMFSTGPVIAAGFIHSEPAGQWATLTKIMRNSLIGLVTVCYVLFYAAFSDDATHPSTAASLKRRIWWGVSKVWQNSPKFIAGFVFMIVLVSLGVFSQSQINTIETIYGWLFLISFIGLGSVIDLDRIRQTGLHPIIVIFFSLTFLSIISFVTVSILL